MWLCAGLVGGVVGLALDVRFAVVLILAYADRRAGSARGPAGAPCPRRHRGRCPTPSSGSRPNCEPAGRLPARSRGDRKRRRCAAPATWQASRAFRASNSELPCRRRWRRGRAAAFVPGTNTTAGALAVAHEVGGRDRRRRSTAWPRPLRARLAVVAEAHALSAQARYSAIVIGLGPFAYFAFSVLVDPGAADSLLGTPGGRMCALIGVALELAGAWWMHRILRNGAAA